MVTPVSNSIQIEAPVPQIMSTESRGLQSLSHCEKAACCIGSTMCLGGLGMCIALCTPAVASGTPLAKGLIVGGCCFTHTGLGITLSSTTKLDKNYPQSEFHGGD